MLPLKEHQFHLHLTRDKITQTGLDLAFSSLCQQMVNMSSELNLAEL